MITAIDQSRDYPCQTYTVIGILSVLMVFCFQIISLIKIHNSTPEHMLRLASVSLQPSPGFDGQFYLALAKDPFLLYGAERHLDSPVLRARRIGFPLASWLFAPVGAPPAYRLLMTESAFFMVV